MISVNNLKKTYNPGVAQTEVLKGIDLDIDPGEFVAIMGPSGCGKTTLINILSLLDNPTTGEYLFDGESVTDLSSKEKAEFLRGNIGFIFQTFNLISEFNVYENIELPLLYMNVPRQERTKRITAALELLKISQYRKKSTNHLSGGEQQRVAIARALVINPRLILADEPTGNLDSDNSKSVMNALKEINQTGCTVVMVTHSKEDAVFASRVIHMIDGQIESIPTRAPRAEVSEV